MRMTTPVIDRKALRKRAATLIFLALTDFSPAVNRSPLMEAFFDSSEIRNKVNSKKSSIHEFQRDGRTKKCKLSIFDEFYIIIFLI